MSSSFPPPPPYTSNAREVGEEGNITSTTAFATNAHSHRSVAGAATTQQQHLSDPRRSAAVNENRQQQHPFSIPPEVNTSQLRFPPPSSVRNAAQQQQQQLFPSCKPPYSQPGAVPAAASGPMMHPLFSTHPPDSSPSMTPSSNFQRMTTQQASQQQRYFPPPPPPPLPTSSSTDGGAVYPRPTVTTTTTLATHPHNGFAAPPPRHNPFQGQPSSDSDLLGTLPPPMGPSKQQQQPLPPPPPHDNIHSWQTTPPPPPQQQQQQQQQQPKISAPIFPPPPPPPQPPSYATTGATHVPHTRSATTFEQPSQQQGPFHSAPPQMTPTSSSYRPVVGGGARPSPQYHLLGKPTSNNAATAVVPPPPPPPLYVSSNSNPTVSSSLPHPPATTATKFNGYPPHPPLSPLSQQQQQHHYYEEKPKIDPSQIPRPPSFLRPQDQQPDGYLITYYPKAAVAVGSSSTVEVPPPADSRYTVIDDGNASPDLIRSTVYAMPLHRGIWHHTGDIPLGMICTPLSIPSQDFVLRPRTLPPSCTTTTTTPTTQQYQDPQAIPVVVAASAGMNTNGESSLPPRCENCAAYVSPFFGLDGKCNLCGHRNRTIMSNVTPGSLPMQFGTVEYDVSGPYVTRSQPVQNVSLYAMDLTCPNVMDYIEIIERVGMDMATHFQRQRHFHMNSTTAPAPPRIGVCLVSVAGVIFLTTMTDRSMREIVMSDVTEQPFAPLPLNDWTCELSSENGMELWQHFCRNELPDIMMKWKQHVVHKKTAYGVDGLELSCGGVALAVLAYALAESGGRGTVISWRRPNFGVGELPYREQDPRHTETTASYTPLQLLTEFKSKQEEAAATFYNELASQCVRDRVTLDILMHTTPSEPQPPLDLASLGELCKKTSGRLIWINGRPWQEAMYEELTRQVQTFCGWDGIFKIRTSEGIHVKSFYSGSGTLVETMTGGSSELELSSISPSTCIAVELEHRVGGISKDRGLIFIQTALLYSTWSGKRRVRVSTLAIRTTNAANEVYRSVDFSALTTIFLKSTADYLRRPLTEEEGTNTLRTKARAALYHRCLHILACYRLHTPAMNSPNSQLILPEKMHLLPLFCMCLLKSPMLRPGMPRRIQGMHAAFVSPTCDERAFYNFHAGQIVPSMAMILVHPNLYSVGCLDGSSGQWVDPDEVEMANGFVLMPPSIAPSMESLDDDGLYLLDGGLRIYLYIGASVAEHVRNDLLDDSTPSDLKNQIESLVYQMRAYSSSNRGSENEFRPTWVPVIRVLQQDGHQSPQEAEILNLMVADVSAGEKDYVDFLCTLHRGIRDQVEGGKK